MKRQQVNGAAAETPPAAAPLREADFLNLLRIKYAAPQFVLVDHVPDATGYSKSRTADALAFGAWASVGLHTQGFEIKISRSDWRREVNNPEKALAFAPFCNYWWICAPKGCVKLEELPATWGLMVPRGAGLGIERQATFVNAKPMPFDLTVAMLRKFTSDIDARVRAAHIAGRNELAAELKVEKETWAREKPGLATAKAELRAMTLRAESAEGIVERFSQATGVHLSDWRFDQTAAAFQTGDGP